MKKRGTLLAVMLLLGAVVFSVPAFAHSGRTDANGGHRDNKNKSGLGSYHYHCGGNPAHLHDGGVCPYAVSAGEEEAPAYPSSVEAYCEMTEFEVGGGGAAKCSISPSDAADGSVKWSSSNGTVATIDGDGNIKAVGAGTATITATAAGGAESSFEVTVKAAEVQSIQFDPEAVQLTVGEKRSLSVSVTPENAAGQPVTWSSSDATVAAVDGKGTVTALKAGKAEISAASANGVSGHCSVEVLPVAVTELKVTAPGSMKVGEKAKLRVQALPENAENVQLRYESSDRSVAEISDTGEVTARAKGRVTLTVANQEVKSTVELKILPIEAERVEISADFVSVQQGESRMLEAVVYPENAEDKSIKWSVDNGGMADIKDGEFIGRQPGVVTVTATAANGKTASFEIEVQENPAAGIIGTVVVLGALGGAGAYLYRKKKSR